MSGKIKGKIPDKEITIPQSEDEQLALMLVMTKQSAEGFSVEQAVEGITAMVAKKDLWCLAFCLFATNQLSYYVRSFENKGAIQKFKNYSGYVMDTSLCMAACVLTGLVISLNNADIRLCKSILEKNGNPFTGEGFTDTTAGKIRRELHNTVLKGKNMPILPNGPALSAMMREYLEGKRGGKAN